MAWLKRQFLRWELGLAHPKPEIWARLRNITLKASSSLDEDLVRLSPVYKVLVDMKDLTHPIVASKGIIEAVEAVGAAQEEEEPFFDVVEFERKRPTSRSVALMP